MRGDELASETLDASQHCLGCLLKSFLVPTTHDLMFREDVGHCLHENWHDAQHRLNDLITHRNRVCQWLDDLLEAHRAASGSSQKRIKKNMDLQGRDLENLKGCISHEESYLWEDTPEQDVQDDLLNQGAEAEMPPVPGADDTPSQSAMAPVSGSPRSEDPAMEVDEGAVGLPPTSPVTREDDNLLTSNDAVGVEVGLAHLMVSSPSGQDWKGEEASVAGAPPPLEEV